MITEDQWDEDIWGVEHPDDDFKGEIPKLIFYFGQNVGQPGRRRFAVANTWNYLKLTRR